MDINTGIYQVSARKLKLSATLLDDLGLLHIPLGGKNYYFMSAITPLNNASSIYIAKSRGHLHLLLRQAGFPVPNSLMINRDAYSVNPSTTGLDSLKMPLVIKPQVDTQGGYQVYCNIKTQEELAYYMNKQCKAHPMVLVEEYQDHLKEYRVLILNHRVIGVVQLVAPKVIGDGRRTIEQLISAHNKTIPRYSCPIIPDEECMRCLAHQGVTLTSIPSSGLSIQLQYSANRSTGGSALALGRHILPENARHLCRAAQYIGLDWVCLGLFCEDINRPFSKTKWTILEADFRPDISLYEYPDAGDSIDVGKQLLGQILLTHPFSYFFHRLRRILF
ncbi:MAG: hypothetical protein ACHP6H_00400 [Legionellales bacterium]